MGVNQFVRKQDERQAILGQLPRKERLYYLRDCLLPCLKLEVRTKERGREELSSLEVTLLQLIERGVRTQAQLSYLTGLAERSIEKKLLENQGQSLLEITEDGVFLTSLGSESLRLGVPVRLIDRELLYCPLSRRLLPREAYSREFLSAREMEPGQLKFRELLAEPEKVPLTGLNLTAIEDKHAVKLSDEVVDFEQCLGHEPGFIDAHLGVAGKKGPAQAWMAWDKTVYSYALEQVKPLVERFDPSQKARKDGDQTLAGVIESELEELGTTLKSGVKVDRGGMPYVIVSEAKDEWLASAMPDEPPWILMCGTSKTPPLPLSRFPTRKADVLKGYTLQVWVENKRLEAEIDLLKAVNEAIESYFAQKVKERGYSSVEAMLNERFSPEDLSRAAELVEHYQIKRRLGKYLG